MSMLDQESSRRIVHRINREEGHQVLLGETSSFCFLDQLSFVAEPKKELKRTDSIGWKSYDAKTKSWTDL